MTLFSFVLSVLFLFFPPPGFVKPLYSSRMELGFPLLSIKFKTQTNSKLNTFFDQMIHNLAQNHIWFPFGGFSVFYFLIGRSEKPNYKPTAKCFVCLCVRMYVVFVCVCVCMYVQLGIFLYF